MPSQSFSSSSHSSSTFVSASALCQLLQRLLQQHKYAAKPVLAMYVVQMQLMLPFFLRSGAAMNLSALMKPFHRMYAKGVEFDTNTLIMIASV